MSALRFPLSLLDPGVRSRWALSNEADHVEELYGVEALEWVRQRIVGAPKGARAKLYRLHDELARRRGSSTGPRHH